MYDDSNACRAIMAEWAFKCLIMYAESEKDYFSKHRLENSNKHLDNKMNTTR